MATPRRLPLRPTIFREPAFRRGEFNYYTYLNEEKVTVDERVALAGQRDGKAEIKTIEYRPLR